MKLGTKLLFAAPIVIVLLMAVTWAPAAKAWDGGLSGFQSWGGGGCGWGSCDYHHHYWNGCEGCGGIGQNFLLGGGTDGAYYAGQQDAQYDIQNNLQYQPYGSCLPCHSQDYWSNFHQGYDSYWNSHQSQASNQGSSINIYGNNNYVQTNQYSNQQQNPLQQLGHVVCGLVNCNQSPLPQQAGWGP